jgi:hypothetical protein
LAVLGKTRPQDHSEDIKKEGNSVFLGRETTISRKKMVKTHRSIAIWSRAVEKVARILYDSCSMPV